VSDERLADFFSSQINPLELPPMAELWRARDLLGAFITLFHGNEEQVLVRLLVLREIGARGHEPRWSPQQLEAHFAYVNSVKLRTVLGRLRENGLLLWDGDEGLYQIAETGRVALAALSTLLAFADQDAELGYLTAQVAGQQQVGKVSNDSLQHLLARLNELFRYFEDALESQSEHQIRKAQHRLESVWRWVQKGTALTNELMQDEQYDRRTLDAVQAIHDVQSRLLRLTGVFQRRLNQLQSQRVHLGESGLTTSDIGEWLRGASQTQLASFIGDMSRFPPQLSFLTGPETLDIAEFELVDRERLVAAAFELPNKQTAPDVGLQEAERLYHAEDMHEQLVQLSAPAPLHELVLGTTYAETAYRLSLLSLIGDNEAAVERSVVGDIVRLPLRLFAEAAVEEVDHPEVASISRGELRPS
jgi:hypothetical protein